jgi:hypothetical protein
VAAEVGDQPLELGVGHVRHRSQDRFAVGGVGDGDEAVAEDGRIGVADQRLVLLVAHLVDAAAQGVAAGGAHGGFEPGAVFGLEDLPAGTGEEGLEAAGADTGDDPVETLAVEVDDQDDVAEALDRLLGHRLPDVALVELGVAEEGDEAP